MEQINSLKTAVAPSFKSLTKKLIEVRQWGSEKLGTAEEVTELPQEFRDLEDKVDKLRLLHENLLQVAKTYTLPHYDYDPPLQESAFDFANKVTDKFTSLAVTAADKAGQSGSAWAQQQRAASARNASTKEEIPSGLSHAFARVGLQGAMWLGTEEPLGAALKKFAQVHERVGNARLKQDSEIITRFYKPFGDIMKTRIEDAMKARREVSASRLRYDATKHAVRTATPARAEELRREMEQAEDEFVVRVEEAMTKMRAVLENPEPLKCLADLVAAQLAYFKEAHLALAELSPEIDELQVTNEALLRHPGQ